MIKHLSSNYFEWNYFVMNYNTSCEYRDTYNQHAAGQRAYRIFFIYFSLLIINMT